MNFYERFPQPVTIASLEAYRFQNHFLVQATSEEGVTGVATVNDRLAYLWPVFRQFIIPYFVGKDARDLPSLVEGVYTYRSVYKLAGIAFWNPVAYAELAILDLLGKLADCPVGELLGTVIRQDIPVYLSSLRRDTTPEEEVAWLVDRLAETGATAVKLKIGGRMSRNADASPGRTKRLIRLARKTFGDEITIYVDANGSYDAACAIEVGTFLAGYSVDFLEEPCPWQAYWETKRVTDALVMPVAGGEQDSSLEMFAWMIRDRVVDVVQPDVMYNGGLIRALQVAKMAAAAGMSIMPHSPKVGAEAAAVLHFCSVAENMGPYQEWRGEHIEPVSWCSPAFEIRDGCVHVPAGPGLGVDYDPGIWKRTERLI